MMSMSGLAGSEFGARLLAVKTTEACAASIGKSIGFYVGIDALIDGHLFLSRFALHICHAVCRACVAVHVTSPFPLPRVHLTLKLETYKYVGRRCQEESENILLSSADDLAEIFNSRRPGTRKALSYLGQKFVHQDQPTAKQTRERGV